MFPPSQGIDLDVTAISGICGSISIVCWVVVFSPQIWENFTRGSADGLSLQFIIVWLAGDVFNILGAVLQGVLPTMIILAVYYTLADIVLLLQCFYYRGFTWRDEVIPPKPITNSSIGDATERTGLLPPPTNARERRSSVWSESVDASHLSPVTPLLDTPHKALTSPKLRKRLAPGLSYVFAILSVTAAGVLAWWISNRWQSGPGHHHSEPQTPHEEEPLQFSLWGQIFGWFCAILYLGSRVPQILLNYRRKSCEGVSMLFFLFACFGNFTYVLSIFAYDPTLLCSGPDGKCLSGEATNIYGRYILVNASWLAGSMGTLFLDASIFVQFFLYRTQEEVIEDEEEDIVATAPPSGSRDDRPLLQRGDSEYP